MTRVTIILITIVGLFASTAWGRQDTSPVPVAVISCALRAARAKPSLIRRVFHRTKKSEMVIKVFHDPEYRLLVPATAGSWREDEANRLGLHVPSRFCAAVLASINEPIPGDAAAADAANK